MVKPQQFQPDTRADAALDRTITFWTPIIGRTLNREEARHLRENLAGFFRLLTEWHETEARRAKGRGEEKHAA